MHASRYFLGILSPKGHNLSINKFIVTFLTLPNKFNDKEHLWKISIQNMQKLLRLESLENIHLQTDLNLGILGLKGERTNP